MVLNKGKRTPNYRKENEMKIYCYRCGKYVGEGTIEMNPYCCKKCYDLEMGPIEPPAPIFTFDEEDDYEF